ncbi:MAG: VTT domain-containing protein [archaeon]|jgi:membrane-associated protein
MVGLINLLLHLDEYIGTIIQTYGTATYLILFFVIFIETGLVFFPFFPGDSLIFVAGAFASTGVINFFWLFIILSFAAILGDSINYSIGKYLGKEVFLKRHWINEQNIEKTKDFFKRHGGKTIIFARFIPIIRTFAPFVAGVGKMNYLKFFAFNVIGAISWVISMLTLGYYFGTIPFVKENLSIIIIVIIIISFIPAILAWISHKK